MASAPRVSTAVALLAMALGSVGAGTATVLAEQSTGDARQHRAAGQGESPTTATTGAEPTTTTTSRKPPKRKTTSSKPKPSTTKASQRPSTTSKPPSTTTTPRQPKPAGPAQEVVQLLNQARADAGCNPVRVDARLTEAADKHSSDMAQRDYFSHDTPEGEGFDDRIRAEGYPSPGAENIAQGYRGAEQVMDAWMKSSGHRNNILNCGLRAVGIGLAQSDWVWTQDFGY